jgi:molybdopterin-guanine dinucleotide biosynthesis protein A
MQGRDKGLEPFQGKPLAAWVLERVKPQVDRLVISANRNLDEYRQLCDCPVVTDRTPDYPGPLAGILAAAGQTQAPWLLVVPCDMPRLPADLMTRLHQSVQQDKSHLAIAHDGKRTHLCLLMHREKMPSLDRFLASGKRRVMDWIEQEKASRADFSYCPQAFENLNQLTGNQT